MSKAADVIHLIQEGSKIPDINDPIYTKKQKFPKYNTPISPISAYSSADGAKILRSRLPGWTKDVMLILITRMKMKKIRVLL